MFYNQDNEQCVKTVESSANKVGYSNDDLGFECKLIGKHNHYNINATVAVARWFGTPEDTIKEALSTFEPLPHRLQDLGVHHNIRWINDSISTAPETCIAALEALGEDVETLIVGGVDRGINYQSLADYLPTSAVKHVITIPDAGNVIADLLNGGPKVHTAETLEEAVSVAKEVTTSQKTCLLSPAAASYNHFKNFEVRGEAFEGYLTS